MKQYIYVVIFTCLLAYTLSQTSEPKSELEEKCKLEAEPGNGTEECKFTWQMVYCSCTT